MRQLPRSPSKRERRLRGGGTCTEPPGCTLHGRGYQALLVRAWGRGVVVPNSARSHTVGVPGAVGGLQREGFEAGWWFMVPVLWRNNWCAGESQAEARRGKKSAAPCARVSRRANPQGVAFSSADAAGGAVWRALGVSQRSKPGAVAQGSND